MNRRSFLTSTGILLADRVAVRATAAWPLREKARAHYALRIEPCKLDTLWHCHQALHMDFGFMQLVKYVG